MPKKEKPVKNKKKVSKIIGIIVLVALVIVLLLGVAIRFFIRSGAPISSNTAAKNGESAPSAVKNIVESTEVMQYARALKADLKDVLSAMKAMDPDGMDSATVQLDEDTAALKEYLASPVWSVAELVPTVGGEISSAKELVDTLQLTSDTIFKPLISQMRDYPLSAMKSDGGFNVRIILSYLDFLENSSADFDAIAQRLDSVSFEVVDTDGSISSYLSQASNALNSLRVYEHYFPMVRKILGDGEDRLYVFAAQNSSEIRASGGFPGSVGVIRIRDGHLSLENFQSVYQVFANHTSYEAHITPVEDRLFSARMYLPWDADFSPDFERVAYIWALAYQEKNGEHVDGVVSATPAIIQKFLAVLGGITLSDGTELDGDNATKILQHDLYFKYMNANSSMNYNAASQKLDELFSETAQKAMGKVVSSFGFSKLSDYISIFREGIDERILMIWMADEELENMIREAGWSGSLNHDENEPKVGIYFNCASSSKMGWYLDIDAELGEPVLQEDGALVYDLKVSFSNVMTQADLRAAGSYIIGRHEGSILSDIFIFAPAGGTVTDINSSDGWTFFNAEYGGLQVEYILSDTIRPGGSIVVTCKITTAPGVEEPLGFLITPTLQNYRGE